MIDTHAHLDFKQFNDDRKKVIARFFDNGGKAIINIGVDKERNEKTLEIAKNHPQIFAALGFHPEGGNFSLDKVEIYLKEKCQNFKVKAIGEIGLDYFHSSKKEDLEFQKKLFVKQLEVAKELDLPVIIHCRDAYDDLLEIISADKFKELKMVVHCFCGGAEEAKKFLQLPNLKISFTGNITFVKEGDKSLEAVAKIPLDRIMAETDCPFLAPVPNRGKRNEPAYVKHVIEKIAEIKNMSFEEIEKQTDENAINFFGLKI